MNSKCFIWKGSIDSDGYGRIESKGKIYSAHRLSYEIHKGPIPDGLQIDHLCRNRACVNPDHLEAVTQKMNILRGVGAAAQNAKKTHCPKGHQYTIDNTYYEKNGSRRCRICKCERSRNQYQKNHSS